MAGGGGYRPIVVHCSLLMGCPAGPDGVALVRLALVGPTTRRAPKRWARTRVLSHPSVILIK